MGNAAAHGAPADKSGLSGQEASKQKLRQRKQERERKRVRLGQQQSQQNQSATSLKTIGVRGEAEEQETTPDGASKSAQNTIPAPKNNNRSMANVVTDSEAKAATTAAPLIPLKVASGSRGNNGASNKKPERFGKLEREQPTGAKRIPEHQRAMRQSPANSGNGSCGSAAKGKGKDAGSCAQAAAAAATTTITTNTTATASLPPLVSEPSAVAIGAARPQAKRTENRLDQSGASGFKQEEQDGSEKASEIRVPAVSLSKQVAGATNSRGRPTLSSDNIKREPTNRLNDTSDVKFEAREAFAETTMAAAANAAWREPTGAGAARSEPGARENPNESTGFGLHKLAQPSEGGASRKRSPFGGPSSEQRQQQKQSHGRPKPPVALNRSTSVYPTSSQTLFGRGGMVRKFYGTGATTTSGGLSKTVGSTAAMAKSPANTTAAGGASSATASFGQPMAPPFVAQQGQQLHLVENQRQKVRSWLDSQPFFTSQRNQLEEKWTESRVSTMSIDKGDASSDVTETKQTLVSGTRAAAGEQQQLPDTPAAGRTQFEFDLEQLTAATSGSIGRSMDNEASSEGVRNVQDEGKQNDENRDDVENRNVGVDGGNGQIRSKLQRQAEEMAELGSGDASSTGETVAPELEEQTAALAFDKCTGEATGLASLGDQLATKGNMSNVSAQEHQEPMRQHHQAQQQQEQVAKTTTGDEIMDFNGNCSLCHYLVSIQAVTHKLISGDSTTVTIDEDKVSGGSSKSRRLDEAEETSAIAEAATVSNSALDNNNGLPNQRRQKHSVVEKTTTGPTSIISQHSRLCNACKHRDLTIWNDIKPPKVVGATDTTEIATAAEVADGSEQGNYYYQFQATDSVIRKFPANKPLPTTVAAVAAVAIADFSAGELYEQETTVGCDEAGEATRPSSAHSKLYPDESRAGGSSETGDNDHFEAAADGRHGVSTVDQQRLLSKNRQTLRKPSTGQRSMKVVRGLSLEAGRQQMKLGSCRPNRMRIGLANKNQSKSQSSRLIVINSDNASYTIQVTTQPLPTTDYDGSRSTTSEIATNERNSGDHDDDDDDYNDDDDQDQGPSFAATSSEARLSINPTTEVSANNQHNCTSLVGQPPLVDLQRKPKQPEQLQDQEQQQPTIVEPTQFNRARSYKKFLVKKISASSKVRTENTKRTQQQQPELRDATPIAAQQSASGKTISSRGPTLRRVRSATNASKTQANGGSDCLASEDFEIVSASRLASEGSVSLSSVSSKSNMDSNIDHKSLMETVRLNWQASQVPPGAVNSAIEDTNVSCTLAAKRLRELVAHLEHGSVPQSVLYQTLDYAASVLDSVTMDQISRVSDEEDGDLSEVQSDAVPNEVRKWLETTFTRNSISQKRKSEDKLKFRSVANAIRAGIVVDRIYRRMSASTPFVSQEVSNLLKSIDDWSFDCFTVNQASNGQVLKSVGYELFNRYGLMYKFKIPTTILKNFLTQIELGYVKHKNPYHNNLHAADVTQTVHYMLWQAGLTNWLTDLEIFATLLAAIIHDYLHTGTTNNFHVMSQSDTALIYNDRAVLENFHICQAFTLMKNEDCNILAGLSKDEYREFRSLVIDMVLATDMSSHFQQIKAMKNILNHSDNINADKSKILSLVIHISDISHPAKEWELHSNWTQLLMEEFFRQGDREKELDLECSPLCDRETTLVAESQLGFIEFIVSPSLEVCGDVLDRVHYQMAEANARPVLPASAKAASIVATTANAGQTKAAAIEAAPDATLSPATKQQHQQQVGDHQHGRHHQHQRHPLKLLGSSSSSSSTVSIGAGTTASSGSLAASLVSSETLTSNLRKIIVSSSASIGRKLNISSSSSPQAAQVAAVNTVAQPQSPSPLPLPAPPSMQQLQLQSYQSPQVSGISTHASGAATTTTTTADAATSDFEARQANYKHPVISCDSSSGRPKSTTSANRVTLRESGGDDNNNQAATTDNGATARFTIRSAGNSSALETRESLSATAGDGGQHRSGGRQINRLGGSQQSSMQQLNRLAQTGNEAKRSTSSALSACSQTSRSAPTLQPLKIHRPWIACLERNKRMWQERAVIDAQARELKERLKQQQIDSPATPTLEGGQSRQ